ALPSMPVEQDTSFARLTSLAVHDLRTPLATIIGFARTSERSLELEPPLSRYIEMIIAAAEQMTELLEQVGLAARIADGRYEPVTERDAPVILAEDMKDLGAAVAIRAIRALGGSVELDGERLLIRLASEGAATAAGP